MALSAHVGNRPLTDGTYRIDAQRGSEALFAVLVSVDHGRIIRPRIVAPALSDPCATGLVPGAGGPIALAARSTALASARLSAAGESVKRTAAPKQREAATLGAAFTTTSADTANLIRLFVLCAVGLAIALLGAAAVPNAAVPTSALGALLVRRRIEVALAGAWALLVAVVSYLLSMQ
jgi:hypothetical protein